MFGRRNKQTIYWILQLGGWSVFAMVHIFFSFIAGAIQPKIILDILLYSFFFLVTTHFYRLFILRFGWLKLPVTRLIPAVLISTFLLGIIHYLFEITKTFFMEISVNLTDLFSVLVYIFGTMTYYLLWASLYFIYHYFERMNESLKYEAASYEIELNKLKSQLNPHFIFNALNSIRALIDEDPAKSKNAVTQLSNLLRNSLIMNRQKLITLRDEMKTVRDYLSLEAIRLEERLTMNLNIHPETGSYMVPPMMLQTLVENGIKHGVSRLQEGGHISLITFTHDKSLTVEIRNSGQYIPLNSVTGMGFGIENTIKRLELIYGPEASFFIGNENDHTVLTRIIIPIVKENESISH